MHDKSALIVKSLCCAVFVCVCACVCVLNVTCKSLLLKKQINRFLKKKKSSSLLSLLKKYIKYRKLKEIQKRSFAGSKEGNLLNEIFSALRVCEWVWHVVCICLCSNSTAAQRQGLTQTYWKSEGDPNLFTSEHLPTCSVLRVLLCTSAAGPGLRGDADLAAFHSPSISFSGFLGSSSSFTIFVSLWGHKDDDLLRS